MRIAFVVGRIPTVSGTFITSQVASLMRRGYVVSIFSFRRGDIKYAAEDYAKYHMSSITSYLDFPKSWPLRVIAAIKSIFKLSKRNPLAILRALNVFKYKTDAWSLRLLCWAGPLADLQADLVHCHFGPIADQFRVMREVLGLRQPWITTFYGYDVSQVPTQRGKGIYSRLMKSCPHFIVMSENMKQRVVALGFPDSRVSVIPIGIDVGRHAFRSRTEHNSPVELITVARLVEKKGIDDLLRALALARIRTTRPFTCTIVGDGPLRQDLQNLAREQRVEDIVSWTGFMQQEDMLRALGRGDIYVQPSKTAMNGDME